MFSWDQIIKLFIIIINSIEAYKINLNKGNRTTNLDGIQLPKYNIEWDQSDSRTEISKIQIYEKWLKTTLQSLHPNASIEEIRKEIACYPGPPLATQSQENSEGTLSCDFFETYIHNVLNEGTDLVNILRLKTDKINWDNTLIEKVFDQNSRLHSLERVLPTVTQEETSVKLKNLSNELSLLTSEIPSEKLFNFKMTHVAPERERSKIGDYNATLFHTLSKYFPTKNNTEITTTFNQTQLHHNISAYMKDSLMNTPLPNPTTSLPNTNGSFPSTSLFKSSVESWNNSSSTTQKNKNFHSHNQTVAEFINNLTYINNSEQLIKTAQDSRNRLSNETEQMGNSLSSPSLDKETSSHEEFQMPAKLKPYYDKMIHLAENNKTDEIISLVDNVLQIPPQQTAIRTLMNLFRGTLKPTESNPTPTSQTSTSSVTFSTMSETLASKIAEVIKSDKMKNIRDRFENTLG